MSHPAPLAFDAHRFRSTASHYATYRAPYPGDLIARVASICGLDGMGRLLDLGCGPGMLAIAFAPFVEEAVGVDPEPSMLDAARAAAAGTDRAVRFVEGSSYDLPDGLDDLRLVTIGRAFHWMDRPTTLATLDRLIQPGGAVVLFSDKRPKLPANAWEDDFEAVMTEFAPDKDGSRACTDGPKWVPHEAVLLASPFSSLERIGRIMVRRLTLDDVVGLALTMSSVSPAVLGDRLPDFEAALRARIAPHLQDGHITDVVEATALIARRP